MNFVRQVLNFLITAFILWLANHFFPTYVEIDSLGTLLIATFLIYVVGTLLIFLLFVGLVPALASAWKTNIIWIVVALFVLALPAEGLALCLVSCFLPGFSIHGFWTYLLLILAIGTFTFNKSEKKS